MWPQWLRFPPLRPTLLLLFAIATVQSVLSVVLRYSHSASLLSPSIASVTLDAARTGDVQGSETTVADVDAVWFAPEKNWINTLSTAINGSGTYGFAFRPEQALQSSYNYCNMPHVRPETYQRVEPEYVLKYVEVLHRHHKRTPYASNTFPRESEAWDCGGEGLFYSAKGLGGQAHAMASTYWVVDAPRSHPMISQNINGSCQFPQITRGGLDDSYQHGLDLRAVYHDLLAHIPTTYSTESVSFRVTNNVITSQVASMVIAGMYPELAGHDVALRIQPRNIDSLEPAYICPAASDLFASYGPGSSSNVWREHLEAASALKTRLDTVSSVDGSDREWSKSYDHYFDRLSSALCHDKPLPCHVDEPDKCINDADADTVLRLGQYEYSFIYRDMKESLTASAGSFGVWISELAQNLRDAMAEGSPDDPSRQALTAADLKYRHNVAHDGSVARLLAVLQVSQMVWPGMGAEVVFELYSRGGDHFIRVLWGGRTMKSSYPDFGRMDMVPVDKVLTYFDALVGVGGSKIPNACR